MQSIIFPCFLQPTLCDHVHKPQFGLLRSFCSAERLFSLDNLLRLCLTIITLNCNLLFLKDLIRAAIAFFSASAFCQRSPSGRFDMSSTFLLVDKTTAGARSHIKRFSVSYK